MPDLKPNIRFESIYLIVAGTGRTTQLPWGIRPWVMDEGSRPRAQSPDDY